jgi:hypothetical protein
MKTPTVSKIFGAQVHEFCFAIGDLGQIHPVDGIDHFGHQPIHIRPVGPYSGYPDMETLPIVLIPNFCYRNIKIILEPVFNSSDYPTLFLQRPVSVQIKPYRATTDNPILLQKIGY